MSIQVHVIDVKNALQNYIWLLEDTETRQVAVVDPTEADLVIDYLEQHDLGLAAIWLTHWHKDHIGGVPELLRYQNVAVYGPREEISKIPMLSHPLQDDDEIEFAGQTVEIIAVPGHTLGHIVYFIPDEALLFCGDTLFAMGCGRVFEGTYEQMYHSLNHLAALPPHTQVYCTHEYTQSNAKFALHVEPDTLAIQQRAKEVDIKRAAGEITLPSTIQLELETNPFLRANSLEEFQEMRQLKDNF